MIVKWNKECVKTIPAGDGEMVMLLGGYNEVAPKMWKQVRPHIEENLDDGTIEEYKPEVDAKGAITGAASFPKLKASEAIKVINGTYSLLSLEIWRKASTLDEVRAAIQDRIAEIQKDQN